MDNDFVSELGVGLLAHRMRRVVDQIMADCRSYLTSTGLAVPAKGVSTVLLLEAEGALGITEISQRLNFSHTLVVRLVSPLTSAGLVVEHRDPNDGRRRVLELTERGRRAAEEVRARFLAPAETAYLNLFKEIGVDVFDVIERLDVALADKSFVTRLHESKAGDTAVRKSA